MRTILITGANRGIGYSTTCTLLDAGYTVIALSKSIDNLTNLSSPRLIIYQVDFFDTSHFATLLEEITHNYNIDIIINNVGIGYFDYVEQLSDYQWSKMIYLNCTLPFQLIRKLLPIMKTNNYGRIINIGSDADSIPEARNAGYCASKYALRALSECLSLEIVDYNISILHISPGKVDTFFNNKKPGDRPSALSSLSISEIIQSFLSYEFKCNIMHVHISPNNALNTISSHH